MASTRAAVAVGSEATDGPQPGALAFEDVFASYRLRVLGFCRKMLHSESDAEDALQEVMLRAFKAWPRFRPDAEVWPWLAVIASNVCRDACRRAAVATAYADALAAPVQIEQDAIDAVLQRERRELVRDALALVPPTYRTPLYLRDIEGWSVGEIARLRGRSETAVRSSLTRARRLLAARVEELARDRNQWPLPATLPLVAGVRARFVRARAAVDRFAAQMWSPLESAANAMSAFGAAQLSALPHWAAAVAGAAGVYLGSDAAAGRIPELPPAVPAAVATAPPPARAATSAPAPGLPSVAPGDTAPPAKQRGDSEQPEVEVHDAKWRDPNGQTATPAIWAEPGDPPVDDGGLLPDRMYFGFEFEINCGDPEKRGPVLKLWCDPPAPVPGTPSG